MALPRGYGISRNFYFFAVYLINLYLTLNLRLMGYFFLILIPYFGEWPSHLPIKSLNERIAYEI
jgi:hypothetical protein